MLTGRRLDDVFISGLGQEVVRIVSLFSGRYPAYDKCLQVFFLVPGKSFLAQQVFSRHLWQVILV
jgi:hypothetical protein